MNVRHITAKQLFLTSEQSKFLCIIECGVMSVGMGVKIIPQLKKNKLLILLIIVIQGRKHAQDIARLLASPSSLRARKNSQPLSLHRGISSRATPRSLA